VDVVSDCVIHGESQIVLVRDFSCFGAISDHVGATAVILCSSSVDYIVRVRLVRSQARECSLGYGQRVLGEIKRLGLLAHRALAEDDRAWRMNNRAA
jgi:hypothetical protein